jgi:hypothetical protein
VRITGRIPKEVPILLIGSDLDGKVFSEPTNTVLLSLHGAGIISHHKLSPEQELILRCPDRNSETAVRIVGEMGSSNVIHTYGLAFVDPNLNFWSLEFPPLTPAELAAGQLSPVCTSCKTLENLDNTSVEADLCAANKSVLRFCKHCVFSTLWKLARTTANKVLANRLRTLPSCHLWQIVQASIGAILVPKKNRRAPSARLRHESRPPFSHYR